MTVTGTAVPRGAGGAANRVEAIAVVGYPGFCLQATQYKVAAMGVLSSGEFI